MEPHEIELIGWIARVTLGYVLLPLELFGVLGNVLSLIVLTHRYASAVPYVRPQLCHQIILWNVHVSSTGTGSTLCSALRLQVHAVQLDERVPGDAGLRGHTVSPVRVPRAHAAGAHAGRQPLRALRSHPAHLRSDAYTPDVDALDRHGLHC